MKLRAELMPPKLDEATVRRLSELAAAIDGAESGQWEAQLAAFNAEAQAQFTYGEFQGIGGGQDHDTWVRAVLSSTTLRPLADITRDELVELVRRVASADCPEHETDFWLHVLEVNFDRRISDLIFWPGEYFGDGNNARELTPEEIVDIARGRNSQDGGHG